MMDGMFLNTDIYSYVLLWFPLTLTDKTFLQVKNMNLKKPFSLQIDKLWFSSGMNMKYIYLTDFYTGP